MTRNMVIINKECRVTTLSLHDLFYGQICDPPEFSFIAEAQWVDLVGRPASGETFNSREIAYVAALADPETGLHDFFITGASDGWEPEAEAAPVVNLITNGTFDSLDGWKVDQAQGKVELIDGVLRITTGDPTKGYSQVTQDIVVVPEATYTLSFRSRCLTAEGCGTFDVWDGATMLIPPEAIPVGEEWQTTTKEFTVPGNITSVQLDLRGFYVEGRICEYDDVVVS